VIEQSDIYRGISKVLKNFGLFYTNLQNLLYANLNIIFGSPFQIKKLTKYPQGKIFPTLGRQLPLSPFPLDSSSEIAFIP